MDKVIKRLKNKHTPCRIRRNARRAQEYRLKKGITREMGTQTDSIEGTLDGETSLIPILTLKPVNCKVAGENGFPIPTTTDDLVGRNDESHGEVRISKKTGFFGLIKNKFKKKSKESKASAGVAEREEEERVGSSDIVRIEEEEKSRTSSLVGVDRKDDVNDLYNNLEDSMRLSRLEEKAMLNVALRHIVRHLHPKGDKITFSSPEAADRIELRTVNLPTNPSQLYKLVEHVFKRRGEEIMLEQLYVDFVKCHGRISFDPRKEWPLSHVHTYHV